MPMPGARPTYGMGRAPASSLEAMSLKLRLIGIEVGCIRCGKRARWLVLNFPLCDECADLEP